jgi:hypothetical protein
MHCFQSFENIISENLDIKRADSRSVVPYAMLYIFISTTKKIQINRMIDYQICVVYIDLEGSE